MKNTRVSKQTLPLSSYNISVAIIGIAYSYGTNFYQKGTSATSVEAVDLFSRTLIPIDVNKYIISLINDFFRQNPDGSWTNGAPSMDGPPIYRH